MNIGNNTRYNLARFGALFSDNFGDILSAGKAIEWCMQNGLLRSEKMCSRCRRPMELRRDHGIGQLRCRRMYFSSYLLLLFVVFKVALMCGTFQSRIIHGLKVWQLRIWL